MAKLSKVEIVRALEGLQIYPAVFLPAPEGGYEVIFPNLPRVRAYGPNREMAELNAVEALTAEMQLAIEARETPPRASDPARLIPDQDEPPGTELVMLTADHAVLRRRLGLEKRERGGVLSAMAGRLGKS